MQTQRNILVAAAGFLLGFAALVALFAAPLGALPGFLVALAVLAAEVVAYFGFFGPRLARWGATGEEARRPMPGDGIAGPTARCTTRAVTIGVPARQVWPWLARLGGWRSRWDSDHLFDTGQHGQAGPIQPEWQQLSPGDRILTIPGPGLEVVAVDDGHYFVARTPDATMSWCLAAEPIDQHSCRLISRWRARRLAATANTPWFPLPDPSSFFTERRMLLTIKAKAEHATQPGILHRR